MCLLPATACDGRSHCQPVGPFKLLIPITTLSQSQWIGILHQIHTLMVGNVSPLGVGSDLLWKHGIMDTILLQSLTLMYVALYMGNVYVWR